MDRFLSNDLTLGAIKNVLSLHILLDYFDADKLLFLLPNGTAESPTLFQPPASVQITNLNGRNVAFSPKDAAAATTFVKSVEIISSALLISVATPAPSEANLTAAMLGHGCSVFAAAEQAFEANNVTGLTVFCLVDEAMIT
ncbi:hypothetical protein SASPL_154477 [Salvia splendens]|uniref:FAS1 domain-containing protein n=1 Tax=Salvia splendens TaxID=180675 RepID=A0A8X8W068_SALSN|nr:hypothetical protein SASPL_154477 [Salvia splendens]